LSKWNKWNNKHILITGAGSSIGQALAKLLAALGAKSILTDIDTTHPAKVIEKGMRKNTFRVLIGADAKFVDILYKILPTHYAKVSNRLLRVNRFLAQ